MQGRFHVVERKNTHTHRRREKRAIIAAKPESNNTVTEMIARAQRIRFQHVVVDDHGFAVECIHTHTLYILRSHHCDHFVWCVRMISDYLMNTVC